MAQAIAPRHVRLWLRDSGDLVKCGGMLWSLLVEVTDATRAFAVAVGPTPVRQDDDYRRAFRSSRRKTSLGRVSPRFLSQRWTLARTPDSPRDALASYAYRYLELLWGRLSQEGGAHGVAPTRRARRSGSREARQPALPGR